MKMIALSEAGSLIGLYVALGVIGAVLVMAIVLAIVNRVRNSRVLASSPYIAAIHETNKRYRFEPLFGSDEVIVFHLNSKRSFDNFNYSKRRDEVFKNRLSHFQDVIRKVDYNVSTLEAYRREIGQIPLTQDATLAKKMKMSLKSFRSREEKLGKKLLRKATTDYKVTLKWEYTSPAGKNHYSAYVTISYSDIKREVARFSRSPKPSSPKAVSKPQPKPKSEPGVSRPLVVNIEEIE